MKTFFIREPAFYILSRCFFVALAMLCSALAALLSSGGSAAQVIALRDYAAHTTTMSLVVLSAGVLGAVLLEDILRKRGG